MGIWGWLGNNWFDLLQTSSIVVGLYATGHTIRVDTNERKIQNLFALTSAHRELWTRFENTPELHRIREAELDLQRQPVTHQEKRFVHLLILHLRTAFKARKVGMEFDDDALKADIRQFFSRPIPNAVWEQSRLFLDRDFMLFVESARESGEGSIPVIRW